MNPMPDPLIKSTGAILLYLLASTYAGSAAAAPYVCEYYSMPGYTLKKTITITNATDTTDALNQAKISFQRKSFFDAQFHWIYCKP